jgi:hypothetical protein
MTEGRFVWPNSPNLKQESPPQNAGFIKFYGLYWHKDNVEWEKGHLNGRPQGWLGQGKIAKDFDHSTIQMNFWKQKGVYILYDSNLQPVYAGQAGISESSPDGIGKRLYTHSKGIYRNGWCLFSWFGFLETDQINLKQAGEKRLNPDFRFKEQKTTIDLKQLLASFEAILIEGFAPRFNARGGDLGKAVLVDQYERVRD